MKIYTTVKIDMESGEILEEESFDYDGPIALCEGDSGGGEDGGDDGGGPGTGGDADNEAGGMAGDRGGGPDSGSESEGGYGDADEAGGYDAGAASDSQAAENAGDTSDADNDGFGGFEGSGFGSKSGIDFSGTSVGPDMAGAMAAEAAAATGANAEAQAEASAQAKAAYGGRNPGMDVSMNDMLDALAATRMGKAVMGLMAGKKDAPADFDMNRDVDPALGAMQDLGLASTAVQGMFDMGRTSMAAMSPNEVNFDATLDANLAAYDKSINPFSVPKAIGKKAAKTGVKTGLMAYGLPSVTPAMALNATMASIAAPAALGKAAFGQATANFGARNDLGAQVNAHAANTGMSVADAAADLAGRASEKGFDVSASSLSDMASDNWGGTPDAPGTGSGETTGATPSASPSASPEPESGGVPYDSGGPGFMNYNQSPLKGYLQGLYSNEMKQPGFMGDAYSSDYQGGAYGFRY